MRKETLMIKIMAYIQVCKFCGEITKGKICPSCKTKPQRKEKVLEQLEIEKEHKEKGYKISDRLFMFERQALLKEYKLN